MANANVLSVQEIRQIRVEKGGILGVNLYKLGCEMIRTFQLILVRSIGIYAVQHILKVSTNPICFSVNHR